MLQLGAHGDAEATAQHLPNMSQQVPRRMSLQMVHIIAKLNVSHVPSTFCITGGASLISGQSARRTRGRNICHVCCMYVCKKEVRICLLILPLMTITQFASYDDNVRPFDSARSTQ